MVLSRSIEIVFRKIPPDSAIIQSLEIIYEVCAHLQSASINVFGCMDNLAQIWVHEKGVTELNGSALRKTHIGFGPKNLRVRNSLPGHLRLELSQLDEWFNQLKDARDATAHRNPIFIPPALLDPAKEEEYHRCNEGAYQALSLGSFDKYREMIEQRDALRHFYPIAHTTPGEFGPVWFHPQLLSDFAIVERWTSMIFDQLP